MAVRTPKYIAGSAQSIGNGASEVYGSAYDVRGYGQISFDIIDAGSGGDLTVKFFGKLDPSTTAPSAITGLSQIGSDVTVSAGTRAFHTIQGSFAYIIVDMQHATGDVNTTMHAQANPETGAGEW